MLLCQQHTHTHTQTHLIPHVLTYQPQSTQAHTFKYLMQLYTDHTHTHTHTHTRKSLHFTHTLYVTHTITHKHTQTHTNIQTNTQTHNTHTGRACEPIGDGDWHRDCFFKAQGAWRTSLSCTACVFCAEFCSCVGCHIGCV